MCALIHLCYHSETTAVASRKLGRLLIDLACPRPFRWSVSSSLVTVCVCRRALKLTHSLCLSPSPSLCVGLPGRPWWGEGGCPTSLSGSSGGGGWRGGGGSGLVRPTLTDRFYQRAQLCIFPGLVKRQKPECQTAAISPLAHPDSSPGLRSVGRWLCCPWFWTFRADETRLVAVSGNGRGHFTCGRLPRASGPVCAA